MKQVESLRREIAPHIRFLRKQVEKLERAEEMRKELVEIYKEYFAREDLYLKSEKQRFGQRDRRAKEELADLNRELEKAKSILTASKNKDRKSDEVVALEGRLSAIRGEKDSVTREIGRLEGEVNADRRAIEKEKDKQKRDEFKTIYLKDLEEVVSTIESLKSVEDAKRLFTEILSTLRAFISKHRGSNDSSLIGEAEKEIDSLSRERSKLEEKLRALNESEAKLNREYNASQTGYREGEGHRSRRREGRLPYNRQTERGQACRR